MDAVSPFAAPQVGVPVRPATLVGESAVQLRGVPAGPASAPGDTS